MQHGQKIAILILLGTILMAYSNCGVPLSSKGQLTFNTQEVPGNETGGGSEGGVIIDPPPIDGDPEVSYQSFQNTVYPIARTYCINCHDSRPPYHAHDDYRYAHDRVWATAVNFSNTANSRLVSKLREGHSCWSNCESNADEMKAAIDQWWLAVNANQGGGGDDVIATSNSLPIAQLGGLAVFQLEEILESPGARIEVQFQILNQFSYRINRMRLINNSGPLRIKNVKLRLNGYFNPQNSNFTVVDMTAPRGTTIFNNPYVTPPQPIQMIVLKDHGEAEDVISLEFEILEFDDGPSGGTFGGAGL